MPSLIEEQWIEFKRNVIEPIKLDDEAVPGLRMCFFAGVAAHHYLLAELSNGPPEKRRAGMVGLMAELEQYVATLPSQDASPGAPGTGGSAGLHGEPPANPLD